MKATGTGGKTDDRVLKEIRDVLLRIEELLRPEPKKEKLKKQLLND